MAHNSNFNYKFKFLFGFKSLKTFKLVLVQIVEELKNAALFITWRYIDGFLLSEIFKEFKDTDFNNLYRNKQYIWNTKAIK